MGLAWMSSESASVPRKAPLPERGQVQVHSLWGTRCIRHKCLLSTYHLPGAGNTVVTKMNKILVGHGGWTFNKSLVVTVARGQGVTGNRGQGAPLSGGLKEGKV